MKLEMWMSRDEQKFEINSWWEGGSDIAPADLHSLVCSLEPRRETAA